MPRFFKDNGLSLVMFGLFAGAFVGQVLTGLRGYNDEQEQHREAPVALADYLQTGHFLEATFENWESEFLQMAALLILSAKLVQRGSAESKDPDGKDEDEETPSGSRAPAHAPWPVRRGGLVLKIYNYSLSLTLAAIFLICFVLHAVAGTKNYNEEARAHDEATLSVLQYGRSATFWFESFQNWQSEFLSVGALVILSIFLRQKGSPESKPVHAPHAQTGQ